LSKVSTRRAQSPAKTREPKLNEQDIIAGTLKLIRKSGVEELSMRRLASELDVTPMAVYYHVKNKDDLLDRVCDAMLARIPTPPPSGAEWQAQLRQLANRLYDLLSRHPGIAREILERPATAHGRRLVRHEIEVLLAAGFDERNAALAVAAFNTMMFGTLAAQLQLTTQQRARARPKQQTTPSSPLGRVAAQLTNLSFAEWSGFAIDAVLASLSLQLERGTAGHPQTGKR
jgi:TetR/AcrR family tetracycline transcriptional repressor